MQGAAAGIVNPQIAGLIQILFRGRERGRAFGALGATIGIATAVGPLLGGALISLAGAQEGWRWVFYVNVPVGLIALPLAWRLLPAPGAGGGARAWTRSASSSWASAWSPCSCRSCRTSSGTAA